MTVNSTNQSKENLISSLNQEALRNLYERTNNETTQREMLLI